MQGPRDRRRTWFRDDSGFSFIELIVVSGIVFVLASAAMPLAQVTAQRQREAELRRTLRELRTAVDKFKDSVDQGIIPTTELKPGSEGYPPDLDTLVEGVSQVGRLDFKLKFLRRVPVDPMTGKAEWGMRCYQDDADDETWCGENVYDVQSTSTATGLDGSKYSEW